MTFFSSVFSVIENRIGGGELLSVLTGNFIDGLALGGCKVIRLSTTSGLAALLLPF